MVLPLQQAESETDCTPLPVILTTGLKTTYNEDEPTIR